MSDDLPTATHSGVVTIMGVDLHVHRLDDGRTIIEADDVHRLFEAMGLGVPVTEADAEALAKVLRGGF